MEEGRGESELNLVRTKGSMMLMGIVGSEKAKFTPFTQGVARLLIRRLLVEGKATGVVSGACHLGGIDVWAAEVGKMLGLEVVE